MRRVSDEAHRPFDLERGPVFRATLFTASSEDHVLLVSAHHIGADGWSNRIFMRELGALYDAHAAGRSPALRSPGPSCEEFARWQAEMLAGPAGERLWSFWREQLAGELPRLDLPADLPRRQARRHRGASEIVTLDSELAMALGRLARSHRTTPFVVLLSVFQALLARYTGQDDMVGGLDRVRPADPALPPDLRQPDEPDRPACRPLGGAELHGRGAPDARDSARRSRPSDVSIPAPRGATRPGAGPRSIGPLRRHLRPYLPDRRGQGLARLGPALADRAPGAAAHEPERPRCATRRISPRHDRGLPVRHGPIRSGDDPKDGPALPPVAPRFLRPSDAAALRSRRFWTSQSAQGSLPDGPPRVTKAPGSRGWKPWSRRR